MMPARAELEEEVRRLRATYDSVVPSTRDLEQRILSRTQAAPPRELSRPTWARDLALSALLLLIIVGAAIGIQQLRTPVQPANVHQAPSPLATSVPTPAPSFPAADLAAAGLTDPALVTPFDLATTDSGHTITLIGAYADRAETILILRVDPPGAPPSDVEIDDDLGMINASSSGREGGPGTDLVYILDGGPHPDVHGLAHLRINISSLDAVPQFLRGKWNFAIDLPVHTTTPLPGPRQFKAGALSVTVEVFEQTPTVIHFQAVIYGTDVPGASDAVTFLDPTGKVIGFGCSAGITVAKNSLNGPPTNARVNCEFPLPRSAGTYQIRIAGRGGAYLLPVRIGDAS